MKNRKIIIAGLLGGIAMVVWIIISYGILPFRDMTIKEMPNEDTVFNVVSENITESGYYYYPSLAQGESAYHARHESGPIFGIIYQQVGEEEVGLEKLVLALLIAFTTPMIPAWILSIISEKKICTYWQRVFIVLLFGIFLAIFSDLSNRVFNNYPLDYTIISAINNVITWALAGSVIAWIIKPVKN